jgi:hypothetical protein
MKRKYYILYKTTNLKNNKFYIGVHETNNLNDGYLGSGKRFKNSIYYHGKENFKREILEYFDNSTEMYQRELEVVNEELLKNPKCLNLVTGGFGGFKCNLSSKHQRMANKYSQKKQKELRETNPEWWESKKKAIGLGNKLAYENGRECIYFYDWNGKSHSAETKSKLSKIKKGTGIGDKNSQYGTYWITDGTINKKIKKDNPLPIGFKKGRI